MVKQYQAVTVAALASIASVAAADIVTYEFSGTSTYRSGFGDPDFFGGPGDSTWTILLELDTDISPGAGFYGTSIISGELNVGMFSSNILDNNIIGVVNDLGGGPDRLRFVLNFGSVVFQFELRDATATVFDNAELPTSTGLTLASFTDETFTGRHDNEFLVFDEENFAFVDMTLESFRITPAPGTAALLALGGLAATRRRR